MSASSGLALISLMKTSVPGARVKTFPSAWRINSEARPSVQTERLSPGSDFHMRTLEVIKGQKGPGWFWNAITAKTRQKQKQNLHPKTRSVWNRKKTLTLFLWGSRWRPKSRSVCRLSLSLTSALIKAERPHHNFGVWPLPASARLGRRGEG